MITIQRSGDRELTRLPWLTSRASFTDGIGGHHGVLITHNEDTVEAGWGFDIHRHRNMEIVTWVLEGTIVHTDDKGHSALIGPGQAQAMSAGTGIMHSERNDSWRFDPSIPRHDLDARVVQMWVVPDAAGLTPAYHQTDIETALTTGEWVIVASGIPSQRETTAVPINNRYAGFRAARLAPQASVQLPQARWLHLFVSRGTVELEDSGLLAPGDGVRLSDSGGQRITASGAAEVLLWEMSATLAT